MKFKKTATIDTVFSIAAIVLSIVFFAGADNTDSTGKSPKQGSSPEQTATTFVVENSANPENPENENEFKPPIEVPEGVEITLIFSTEFDEYPKNVEEINVIVKTGEYGGAIGKYFSLEKLNKKDEWETLPFKKDGGVFPQIGILLPPDSETEQTYDIASNYKTPLKSGVYRISFGHDSEYSKAFKSNEFICLHWQYLPQSYGRMFI